MNWSGVRPLTVVPGRVGLGVGVIVGVIDGCNVGAVVGVCGRVGVALSVKMSGVRTGAGVSVGVGKVGVGSGVGWAVLQAVRRRRQMKNAAANPPHLLRHREPQIKETRMRRDTDEGRSSHEFL